MTNIIIDRNKNKLILSQNIYNFSVTDPYFAQYLFIRIAYQS